MMNTANIISDQQALSALREVQKLTSRPVAEVVVQEGKRLFIDASVQSRIDTAADHLHRAPKASVEILSKFVAQGSSLPHLIETHRSNVAAMRSSVCLVRGPAYCHTDLADNLVNADTLRCIAGMGRNEAAIHVGYLADRAALAFAGDRSAGVAYANFFQQIDGNEVRRDFYRHFGALIALCAGHGVTDGNTILNIANGRETLPQLMDRRVVFITLKLMEELGFKNFTTQAYGNEDATHVYPKWSASNATGPSRWFV